MIWTNITTGTPARTANAKTLSGVLPGRTLVVKASHPGSGPDALLKVVNAAGVVVSQVALSATRPEPPTDYFEPVGDANGTYNYILEPVGATWPSPGISLQIETKETISVPLTPSADGTTLITPFGQRFRAHGQIVPMAGQTVRVVIRGDSIQSNAVTGGSMQLAAILSGGEYMIAWNDAVPSSTLTQFDARYNSIPSWVQYDQDWIQGGTNSPGITTANKDAVASLAQKSIARGAEPVFFAIPPTNGVPTSAHDWNSWLWGWCIKNGFKFVNPWTEIIDPATGGMAAGYTIEGTHPNYPAHVLAAKRILECLRPNASAAAGFKALPFLPNVNAPTNSGISNNALFTNSAGGLATGWSAGAAGGTTVTPTIVALSLPYIGNSQRFQVTTTNPWRTQSRAFTIVGGRRYRMLEYFKIGSVSSDAARNGRLEVRIYDQRGAMLVDHGQWADASVAVEGILMREFVAPVGDTSVTVSYKLFCGTAGNAAADFSIGCQQVYDLTALGLDP